MCLDAITAYKVWVFLNFISPLHLKVSPFQDARFCKPLNKEMIKGLANKHEIFVTVEESLIGGSGSHVAHFLSLNDILDGKVKVDPMTREQLGRTNDAFINVLFSFSRSPLKMGGDTALRLEGIKNEIVDLEWLVIKQRKMIKAMGFNVMVVDSEMVL